MSAPRIAVLGWGSLIWDGRPDFERNIEPWQDDGPVLKLEFSRVSSTRQGALTLVIDSQHGSDCTVAYAISKRSTSEDAICDLRSREGTTIANIGAVFLDDSKKDVGRDEQTLEVIRKWAKTKGVDVATWTDLKSNFEEKCGRQFSMGAALDYLQHLSSSARPAAFEYIVRAPAFVNTQLRASLQGRPWFVQESGSPR